jgi:hypothetical protein
MIFVDIYLYIIQYYFTHESITEEKIESNTSW